MSLTYIFNSVKWCHQKVSPMTLNLICRPNKPIIWPTSIRRTYTKLFSNPASQQRNVKLRNIHSSIVNKQSIVRKPSETKLILDHEFKVPKDTLIFRYDEPRLFKIMNVFAMSQFFFWAYLSHFAFTTMRNIPVSEEDQNNENLAWWKKINFGKYKNAVTVGCFLIGWSTMAFVWLYTLRCVRYLVLKRGGESLTFVTFSPFNRKNYMTVPLQQVSAKQSRTSSKVYLPLKVQGKYLFYVLDMRGEFPNPRLFDYSAGLQRNWAK